MTNMRTMLQDKCYKMTLSQYNATMRLCQIKTTLQVEYVTKWISYKLTMFLVDCVSGYLCYMKAMLQDGVAIA